MIHAFVPSNAVVSGQDPEIVDDILPDVQQIGRTGRLNCTVTRIQNNVVSFNQFPQIVVYFK